MAVHFLNIGFLIVISDLKIDTQLDWYFVIYLKTEQNLKTTLQQIK